MFKFMNTADTDVNVVIKAVTGAINPVNAVETGVMEVDNVVILVDIVVNAVLTVGKVPDNKDALTLIMFIAVAVADKPPTAPDNDVHAVAKSLISLVNPCRLPA